MQQLQLQQQQLLGTAEQKLHFNVTRSMPMHELMYGNAEPPCGSAQPDDNAGARYGSGTAAAAITACLEAGNRYSRSADYWKSTLCCYEPQQKWPFLTVCMSNYCEEALHIVKLLCTLSG